MGLNITIFEICKMGNKFVKNNLVWAPQRASCNDYLSEKIRLVSFSKIRLVPYL